ncbi:2484_t:CDS:1, partial [Dentiscutata erythropus]
EEFNLRTAYSKTIKNKGIVLLNESGNPYPIEDEIFQKELRQNCLIINIGNFDLRKKNEDRNLTNESLHYGESVVISYIDKDGDEKDLLLTLEDFEYDKTLNYENGNGKRRMSYEENRGESENIKCAKFDES